MQGPGEGSPGEQRHPQCHDFHIMLSWCGFSGTFQGHLAEPSGVMGHVHVAVAMQVIRGKSHLPGSGCTEHCWVGHLLCIMRGFVKHC